MKKKLIIIAFLNLFTNFLFAMKFSNSFAYGEIEYLGNFEDSEDYNLFVAKIYSGLTEAGLNLILIKKHPTAMTDTLNYALSKYDCKKNESYRIIFQFRNDIDWVYLAFPIITSDDGYFGYHCFKISEEEFNNISKLLS